MRNVSSLNNEKGVTLIEGLIVVAIIAIAGMVAIPFVSGFIDNRNLRNAASDIAAAITQTKESAMAEDTMYRISFSTFSNRYRIRSCTTVGSTCAAYNTPSNYFLSRYGSGITFTSGDGIYFSPRGLLTSQSTNIPATINITNTRGSTATITVTPFGRANVSLNMQ